MAYELPIDRYGAKMQITPQGVALARTVITDASASRYIALNSGTTFLRVFALSQAVFLKWATGGEDYVNATNFDEMIPPNSYVDFGVPLKTDGTRYTAVQVLEQSASATVVVIEK